MGVVGLRAVSGAACVSTCSLSMCAFIRSICTSSLHMGHGALASSSTHMTSSVSVVRFAALARANAWSMVSTLGLASVAARDVLVVLGSGWLTLVYVPPHCDACCAHHGSWELGARLVARFTMPKYGGWRWHGPLEACERMYVCGRRTRLHTRTARRGCGTHQPRR